MKVHAITTKDNPFNPITDFDNWMSWDQNVLQANTMQKLASISPSTLTLSTADAAELNERAIDSLVSLFPGYYIKVTQEID